MAARRGECAVCRFRYRLRKDGTVQAHHLYCGHQRQVEPCAGSGRPPRPLGFDKAGHPDCGECLAYYYGPGGAGLAEAACSVAIETGGSPSQMLRRYLSAYHERDHKQVSGA